MNPQPRFEGAAPRRQMTDTHDDDYATGQCDIANVSAQSCMEEDLMAEQQESGNRFEAEVARKL